MQPAFNSRTLAQNESSSHNSGRHLGFGGEYLLGTRQYISANYSCFAFGQLMMKRRMTPAMPTKKAAKATTMAADTADNPKESCTLPNRVKSKSPTTIVMP